MAWERFTLEGKDIRPRITLRKGGQIGISQSALTAFQINKFKYVVLFVDKEAKKLGIMFTNDDKESGARTLRVHSAGGATIPAKSFIELYKLPEGSQIDCDFDKKENMLIANYGAKQA